MALILRENNISGQSIMHPGVGSEIDSAGGGYEEAARELPG